MSGMSVMDTAPSESSSKCNSERETSGGKRKGAVARAGSLARFRVVEMKAHIIFAMEGRSHLGEEDPVARWSCIYSYSVTACGSARFEA